MKNTFELEHVGINTDNAGEAEQLALLLCIDFAVALALPVTILGGARYHLIFEAKAQYAYPYMVYMLPLAAVGLCVLAEKLKKISG